MWGELSSLGSAACWALAIVLFRRAADVPALTINLFKNVLALVLMLSTMAVLGVSFQADRSAGDFVRLLVSGALGLGFADAVFLYALKRIGPGLAAIVETAYAPSVVLFAVLLNGEAMGIAFWLGAPIVLLGVFVATEAWRAVGKRGGAKSVEDRGPRGGLTMGQGLALGVFAIVCMALGIVIAKPALERANVIEAAVWRMVGALTVQLAFAFSSASRRRSFAVFVSPRAWRQILPSALLGAYVAMMLWLAGMKLAPASIAAVLGQTSTIFTLVFARALYGERLTRARIIGAALACGGAALLVGARG